MFWCQPDWRYYEANRSPMAWTGVSSPVQWFPLQHSGFLSSTEVSDPLGRCPQRERHRFLWSRRVNLANQSALAGSEAGLGSTSFGSSSKSSSGESWSHTPGSGATRLLLCCLLLLTLDDIRTLFSQLPPACFFKETAQSPIFWRWEASHLSLPITYVGHDCLCKTLLVRPSYLEEGTPLVVLRTRQSGVAFHVTIAHHRTKYKTGTKLPPTHNGGLAALLGTSN